MPLSCSFVSECQAWLIMTHHTHRWPTTSFGSIASTASIGSVGSHWSIGSVGSILSIASVGSVLSIGSIGGCGSLFVVLGVLSLGGFFTVNRRTPKQPWGLPLSGRHAQEAPVQGVPVQQHMHQG